MSGKRAFLDLLKQEGVEIMFGNPGTTELPLMDGLAREPGIRYILALQESVAISMADGYAQASGKLAAVNVHTSPSVGTSTVRNSSPSHAAHAFRRSKNLAPQAAHSCATKCGCSPRRK